MTDSHFNALGSMATQVPLLELSGLKAGYGAIQVIHGVDLIIRPGEALGLLGTNGVGKTTLLKAVMGLLPATHGTIRFAAADVTGLPPHLRARRGIGYVPQGRGILGGLTGKENLSLAWHPSQDESLAEAIERVTALLPRVTPMLYRPGVGLSGGEQQILALARALISRPKLLLLDEPSEGIQPSTRHVIADSLVRLRAEYGLSVLLVEQDLELASRVVQRIAVFERGTIKHESPTAELGLAQLAVLVGVG